MSSNASRSIFFLFIISSTILGPLYGITFGSDTSLTLYNTKQQVRNGDSIAGFAVMAGGFEFFDTSDTATFNSFFGISGYTELNGGTLVLFRDLVIENEGYLANIGNIVGNGYTISLAQDMTVFPLGAPHNCIMNLTSTTDDTAGSLAGGEWSYDGKYYVIAENNQVSVYRLDGINLVYVASAVASSTSAAQARWHPFLYRFALSDIANARQLQTYTFDPNTSTITQNNVVTYASDVALGPIAWHPSGLYLAVAIFDTGSRALILPIDNSNVLDVASTYTVSTGVQPQIAGACDWNITGTYLAVVVPAGGSRVFRFNPSPILLTQVSPFAIASGVSWCKTETNVLVVCGSPSPQIRAFRVNEPSSVNLFASIVPPSSSGLPYVVWGPDTCFAVSTNNAANAIQIYDIDLLGTNLLKLTQVISMPSSPPRFITYNGDYIAMPSDATIYLYQNANFGPPPQFVFSDVNLQLNNNTFFNNSNILFRGNCSINGNGKIFTFSPTSLIKVDTASSLMLSNITLQGIRNGKISCTDSSSTLTLSDVTMQFDTSFSFTAGSLNVLGELILTGSNISFDYNNTESLTILSNSSLIIDAGITFSYSPNSISTSLLQFIDNTSEIILQGGTLVASAAGLSLTKGTLIIDEASTMNALGASAAQGIILGDGINSSNNMTINVKPAATLSAYGFIVNNNA